MRIVKKDVFFNDYEKAINSLMEQHRERGERMPQGFGGNILFNFGTIVVDDELYNLLQKNPEYVKEIKQIFARFKMDDWGEISNHVETANRKLKYLGNAAGMIGMYGTPKGFVRVDTTCFVDYNGERQFCTCLSLGDNKDRAYGKNDAWAYAMHQSISKNAIETILRNTKKVRVK